MEHNLILATLDLPSETRLYLLEMQWVMWGRDLLFSCSADDQHFKLHFLDCRETRWQLYSHMQSDDNPPFPKTELANIKLGRDQHRSPAHLLTEHFGLSLVYGGLELHHDDVVTLLGQ